jgi:hypothetical protein
MLSGMEKPFRSNSRLDTWMSYALPVVWAGLLIDAALRQRDGGSAWWTAAAAVLLGFSAGLLVLRITARRRRALLTARWRRMMEQERSGAGGAAAEIPSGAIVGGVSESRGFDGERTR